MIRGKIATMLQGQKEHISFHTPGHKRKGADITELPYSDNLFAPHSVIKEAEEEIAKRLGAYRTLFLTDGSTAGVHAMLYALKAKGVKKVALSPYSHPSVPGGCKLLGLEPVYTRAVMRAGIPCQPTTTEMEQTLKKADALLLTSPDYYGFFPNLAFARKLCDKAGKPFIVDGAHGSHLHFEGQYAGKFADMWVDGAHKSLPALTQGAAVSAKNEAWAKPLEEGVRLFHTTSPSYPILASVEEAFLYPRNEKLELFVEKFKRKIGAVQNGDWTKVLLRFGKDCDRVEEFLEANGVYPEFNDGNYIMFYLSPCTQMEHLKKLEKLLKQCPAPLAWTAGFEETTLETEAVTPVEEILLSEAVGRVSACDCGIFPPSLPVVRKGEKITRDAVARLMRATHTYGLNEGKILVYSE